MKNKENENIVFSIVVPIYKVEPYLARCVDSLINQTYPHIEIVLVDDGSPDNCPAICDKYAKEDSRIRVIHKKNGGLSDARNAGIDAATGDYIIFVDSDDYIETDTCEKLLPYAQTQSDVLIGEGVPEGGGVRLTHGYTRDIHTGIQYLKIALQHRSMPMAAWLYVYKRSFLCENDLRFRFGITHEDEDFTPRAFLKAKSVLETGLLFYHYIIRDNSITTRKDLSKNGQDLYDTCVRLANIYRQLEDAELKQLLLDSLVMKYLSLSQTGRLYQCGKEYIHKKFVIKNAYLLKTRLKALLYCISPKLYWHINHFTKR
ncbi:MAG: glycosyltransferase [Ruminococcaceae bacterium]|nr:glycosyltransferase [Oscillospiraceae bacterium]